MKRFLASLAAGIAATSLMLAGCGQAALTPTPTRAPVPPTKVAEPTKAPATPTKAAEPTKLTVAPTAAPAKKLDFPEKGKAITLIVPYAAGGAADLSSRVLGSLMEKDLGTPVQVVNRPGAGSQIGLAELAASKPDGYTLGVGVLPSAITTYLEPERKATYTRRSFQPIGNLYFIPSMVVVQAGSPFKAMKDLVDAAKANPGKIKFGTSGLGSVNHIALAWLETDARASFAAVHFDGATPAITALLGGHIDVAFVTMDIVPRQGPAVRGLGVADRVPSEYLPEVKTLESQGYGVVINSVGAVLAPAGLPREAADALVGAMKKGMESEDLKKKLKELTLAGRYMDPQEFASYWARMEADITPLMGLLK